MCVCGGAAAAAAAGPSDQNGSYLGLGHDHQCWGGCVHVLGCGVEACRHTEDPME